MTMGRISIFFALYILLFLGLRIVLFGVSKPSNDSSYESYADLVQNSDKYDGLLVSVKNAKVVRSGHLFLGLFFINYYELATFDGAIIPVYSRESLPQKGRIMEVKGIFRQYWAGPMGVVYGITETGRQFIEPSSISDTSKN